MKNEVTKGKYEVIKRDYKVIKRDYKVIKRDYKVILADPPWTFKTYSDKGKDKSPEKHYNCMTLEDLKALPVSAYAHEDCILFLWVTSPLLPEALELIKAWGFTYKTKGFCWVKRNLNMPSDLGVREILGNESLSAGDKIKILKKSFLKTSRWFWGLGYWTRSNSEDCLIATRGKPQRMSAGVHQVLDGCVGRHSAKPPEARRRIEQLMGDVPRLELFARERAIGWDSVGNEIDGRDIRDVLTGSLGNEIDGRDIRDVLK